MKVHKSIKTFFKGLYFLLKILLAVIVILAVIIVIIALYSRNMRINGFKEFYPKAFKLIEEKYDNKIYLSDRNYGPYIIVEFTAERSFENTYNINDLPEQEFYTVVGHEIFDCFKDEFTKEIENDKINGTDYFWFPVYITIKYGKSSDECVYL